MDERDSFLIVVDVQGKLVNLVHEHERVIRNVERMIGISQLLGIPILWTEQAPEKIGPTVEAVSQMMFPLVKPIPKRAFSCFATDEFRTAVGGLGRSKALIVGIETHVCIYQTARDLFRHGYGVEVAADAVSARDQRNHDVAIARMRHEGIGITSVELAACDWMATADHPKFREIMSHIKR